MRKLLNSFKRKPPKATALAVINPSLPALASSRQSTSPVPSLAKRPSDDSNRATLAKNALLTTLRLTEVSLSTLPLPGITAAIHGIIMLIKAIDLTAQNTQDVQELDNDLKLLLENVLKPLKSDKLNSTSPALEEALLTLTQDLDSTSLEWEQQGSRSIVSRFLSSSEDESNILQFSKRIKEAVARFQIAGDVRREMGLNRIESNQRNALLEGLPRAKYAGLVSEDLTTRNACFEGTRTEVLREIDQWLQDRSSNSKATFWLNGIAGSGKSTIAWTVVQRANTSGIHGTSFFFDRNNDALRNPSLVFPTLAYQMAQSHRQLASLVITALELDPSIGSGSLKLQMDKLILGPLKGLDEIEQPLLIVLDALDECVKAGGGEVLQLLLTAAAELPTTLKILITSRPEPHLILEFKKSDHLQRVVLHDIEKSIVQGDIQRYLRARLHEIPTQMGIQIYPGWLKEVDVIRLTQKAGNLFIHAATSVLFIADDDIGDPESQLRLILDGDASPDTNPYSQLDLLYSSVVRATVSASNENQVVDRFQLVIGTIVVSRNPMSLSALALFLNITTTAVRGALRHLQSVIASPAKDVDPPQPYHPSFREFILDKNRTRTARRFHIDKGSHDSRLAKRCLELMLSGLQRNQLGLQDLNCMNDEVEGLQARVQAAIPEQLAYACRWWGSHLAEACRDDELRQLLDRFAARNLIWWFEALSWLKLGHVGAECVRDALAGRSPTTIGLLRDSYRFILANLEAITRSAMHIYRSALPFTPTKTTLSNTYQKEMSASIRVLQGAPVHWSPCLAICRGHTEWVTSVAFSRSGIVMASGSDDATVRLWDMSSGAPVLMTVLCGQVGPVRAIAFAPDDATLVSASEQIIHRWKLDTGTILGTLRGHDSNVQAVAFSSMGQILASGSNDGTVRIWDLNSGETRQTLDGHFGGVDAVAYVPSSTDANLAVAFMEGIKIWDLASGGCVRALETQLSVTGLQFFTSTDGDEILASCSTNKTIKFWNVQTGEELRTFKGHKDAVKSIAFNSQGTMMASASSDKTIRFWDLQSSSSQNFKVLRGHSLGVNAVCFSPSGETLVSGSHDFDVRLWNVASISNGETDTIGHLNTIRCVGFSPDGSLVASASDDRTIRIWDGHSGDVVSQLKGHAHWVSSLAFSPKGEWLASGSYDDTVRIWDMVSHSMIGCLEGHANSVLSVAFSPTATVLASSSADQNVIIWDPEKQIEISRITGFTQDVTVVDFSDDGSVVGAASADRSVSLWDVATSSMLAIFHHDQDIKSLQFIAPGLSIRIMSRTNTSLSAYPTPPHDPSIDVLPEGQTALISHFPGSGNRTRILIREGCIYAMDGPRKAARICWIPPLYPVTVAASVGTKVALGTQSGAFILLDTAQMSLTLS